MEANDPQYMASLDSVGIVGKTYTEGLWRGLLSEASWFQKKIV